MQPIEVQTALAAAVEEVLETMCFAAVLSSSDSATAGTPECRSMVSTLRFEGKLAGDFRLAVPVRVARAVGSGFLGKEEAEITDSQAGEVVCELANMFCGSALSRLEADTTFHLSHPELASREAAESSDAAGVSFGFESRWFELEEGTLVASLNFMQAV